MSYKRFDPQGARRLTSVSLLLRFGCLAGIRSMQIRVFDESFFAFLRSIFTLAAEKKEEIYV